MEKLGIQAKASLKRMYYDAVVEAGKIKDIVAERDVGMKKRVISSSDQPIVSE